MVFVCGVIVEVVKLRREESKLKAISTCVFKVIQETVYANIVGPVLFVVMYNYEVVKIDLINDQVVQP